MYTIGENISVGNKVLYQGNWYKVVEVNLKAKYCVVENKKLSILQKLNLFFDKDRIDGWKIK